MRKLVYVCVLVWAVALSARAEHVRPEAAAQFARGVLGMKELPTPDNTGSLRAAGRDGAASEPEYYVFNNPEGGWAIISAYDCVTPVLAYSPQGSFSVSDMPENVSWWMEGVSRTISDIRDSGMEVPASVREAWSSLQSLPAPRGGQSKVLETAQWDQGEPYNNYCPVVSGENRRAQTGCVATAMAIICRYNRWPANGKGVIGGYTTDTYKTYIPPYSIDSHYYDWDSMPLTDGGNKKTGWNSRNMDQVAQLMHDCGVMVRMDYTFQEGSGAYDQLVTDAFKSHLSYSDAATQISRSAYNLDEWFGIIMREIDAQRLVFYSGSGSAGGHAFVCDGYDTDGTKLHFNWGWGGTFNGFFYPLPELSLPNGWSFPDNQSALIGLAADTATVDIVVNPRLSCVGRNGFMGMEPVTPADMTAGQEVSFRIGYLLNNEPYAVNCSFKVCLMDSSGTVRQEGWTVNSVIPASNSYYYKLETERTILSVTPALTDYFRLFIRESDGNWTPMEGDRDVMPDVEDIRCGVTPDPVILIPDDCHAGMVIKPELSLGYKRVTEVEWSVNGGVSGDARTELNAGRNVIRADVKYLDGSAGSIFRIVTVE